MPTTTKEESLDISPHTFRAISFETPFDIAKKKELNLTDSLIYRDYN